MPVQGVGRSRAVLAVCRSQPGRSLTDDEAIALCLFTLWAIRTGRPIPGRPYVECSRYELEQFWSDENLEATFL
jgi:hypothetical protein